MSGPGAPRKGMSRLLAAVPFWAWVALAGVVGCTIGLGGFTFTYGQGYSYLGSDPRSCANCHIMRDVYDGWNHSSHKAVATCNDCHTPHQLAPKYLVKGLNGFNHSTAFTFNNFPEPIRIRPFNRTVAQENCIYCHGDLVESISYDGLAHPTDCLRCHARVGHDS
ncbi:MAG: cytochrome c nitrite reductase small subunit [Chloroflexota bacterium]|nr:cytochrome c nitrite reductase small subunit [Chloroflexota bacterium]